ncbi:permease [Amycolatopsis sp. GM8]|uniref:permease n=1 Tax=Amycolatopsis sp. GM8 TaxID=2896530 RepID=UPI001F42AF70|nr:permease [Amycolatopsis sp. GM8]
MTASNELEARVAALEARLGQLAADARAAREEAAAARHLAAARDRDIADLGVKVDANRAAINALGEQTRERFDVLERKVDNGFAEVRGKLDATAAGQQQIVGLLNTLIGQQDSE